jgi:hypothetical protein
MIWDFPSRFMGFGHEDSVATVLPTGDVTRSRGHGPCGWRVGWGWAG